MADSTSTKDRRVEKNFLRHLVLPVEKRAEAEVDEAEQLRAVERVAPGALLFLKTAHLPEAVEQQAGGDERGQNAERLEQAGAGGFRADDAAWRAGPRTARTIRARAGPASGAVRRWAQGQASGK